MKNRFLIALSLVVVSLVVAAGSFASRAQAALTQTVCNVSSVGWRDDIKALRIDCGGKAYFAREATANPSCTFKASMDVIKMWQTAAQSALLSGKPLNMFVENQGGCNTGDLVPREVYLQN